VTDFAVQWSGLETRVKQIGFVAAVFIDALFNDSAPTVMNSYVNRCDCLHICQTMGLRIRTAILRKKRSFSISQKVQTRSGY
jgi:hypothetical protein